MIDINSVNIASSKVYYVILLDVKWYMKGIHRNKDGELIPVDMNIAEPRIMDESLSLDEAKKRADELNASIKDNEIIDIEMENGNHYHGKRYYYTYYSGV